MNRILQAIVDNRRSGSLAHSWRLRRIELFRAFIDPLRRPLAMLDVGGTQGFWESMGLTHVDECHVVLLNLSNQSTDLPNFTSIVGDATDLRQFADGQFDVVFSNSVIEHLGTFERQQRMACEVRRVGKSYFVQTPSRSFPMEPHFLVPFFHFLPLGVQVELTRRFDLGWYKKIPDRVQARKHVMSHRLLTDREMRALFPEGRLYKEKVFGMTKSLIAYAHLSDTVGEMAAKTSGGCLNGIL